MRVWQPRIAWYLTTDPPRRQRHPKAPFHGALGQWRQSRPQAAAAAAAVPERMVMPWCWVFVAVSKVCAICHADVEPTATKNARHEGQVGTARMTAIIINDCSQHDKTAYMCPIHICINNWRGPSRPTQSGPNDSHHIQLLKGQPVRVINDNEFKGHICT